MMREPFAWRPKHSLAVFRQAIKACCVVVLLIGTLIYSPLAHAQRRSFDANTTRNAPSVKNIFNEVIAPVRRSTVLIRCGGNDAAYGVIVGADGYILTKASELHGKITVRLSTGDDYAVKIVGVADKLDLAMLRLELDLPGLQPIKWGDATTAQVGQFVAAVGPGPQPIAVGVISVGRRKIPSNSAMLGVGLEDSREAEPNEKLRGVRIVQVLPESAAEKAGLHVDDVVVSCQGTSTSTQDELVDILRDLAPGDEVKLKVRRGDDELALAAVLDKRPEQPANPNPAPRRRFQGPPTGQLSKRSVGFPAVIQHDTVLRPEECGGPLVLLDGTVIGLNIARAGRVETYALPPDVIIPVIENLKKGRFPVTTRPATSPSSGPMR